MSASLVGSEMCIRDSEMAGEGLWGLAAEQRGWQRELASQLKAAYADFKDWQLRARRPCSQKMFRVSTLGLASLLDWP
eukprot:130041-Alexandrium_andersonii.AAC.1